MKNSIHIRPGFFICFDLGITYHGGSFPDSDYGMTMATQAIYREVAITGWIAGSTEYKRFLFLHIVKL